MIKSELNPMEVGFGAVVSLYTFDAKASLSKWCFGAFSIGGIPAQKVGELCVIKQDISENRRVINVYDLLTPRPLGFFRWSFFAKNGVVVWRSGLFLFCVCLSGLLGYKIGNPEIREYFTSGNDCENNIIHEINRADKIDIAIYSVTSTNISNAIIAAHNRGAKIRIVADRAQAAQKYSQINMLTDAGVPIRVSQRHKIEHNKFAIFDDKILFTGSYNWTVNAANRNSENCLFVHRAMPKFVARFEYLWDLYR